MSTTTTTATTAAAAADPAMAFVADMQQAGKPKAPEVTVESLLAKKKVEVQARELQAREEGLETKAREEQLKSFARATKLATEANVAERERQQQLEDTPSAREEALRQYGELREMGVTGTGKRLTADSPLTTIVTENEIMHQQLNRERSSDMPIVLVHGMVRMAAQLPPLWNLRGAADDLEVLYETSRSGTTREERMYYRTMQQLSIKYGSYFAMSPEMWMVMQVVNVLKTRWEFNRLQGAMQQGSAEVDDATNEALGAFEVSPAAPVPTRADQGGSAVAAALEEVALPRQTIPDGPVEVPKRGARKGKGGAAT